MYIYIYTSILKVSVLSFVANATPCYEVVSSHPVLPSKPLHPLVVTCRSPAVQRPRWLEKVRENEANKKWEKNMERYVS